MWGGQDGVCGVISVVPNVVTQLSHPLYSSPFSFMHEASLRPQGGAAIHHLTSHLLRTSQPLQHCGEFTACCWQYWSVGLPVWLLTLFSYTVILSPIDIWTNGWFNFKSKWLQQQAVIANFLFMAFFLISPAPALFSLYIVMDFHDVNLLFFLFFILVLHHFFWNGLRNIAKPLDIHVVFINVSPLFQCTSKLYWTVFILQSNKICPIFLKRRLGIYLK